MKKADNFDASKWLVENKITTQSRLNEEEYSSERINQRDVETASGEVINHTFDTIDMIDLNNGYKVKITTTYYFRDPGVKGYTSTASDENPMLSGVKTTLMDPSGKAVKNHNFTGSSQWWMLQSGKDKFIPYITEWWKDKINKLGLNKNEIGESKLNEALPSEMVKDYWSIMVENQPEDVINILVGLTNGDLSFEKFSLNTANDVYDSFNDEMPDDDEDEF